MSQKQRITNEFMSGQFPQPVPPLWRFVAVQKAKCTAFVAVQKAK
ncbi:hypothetical protein LTSEHVI_0254 [Salmonella enterica subsp. enterica serovar Hvittingfoss str. A4-620]|nr:hypothetical protein LTSEHVI_0254 [Salmonella enterica subsp. enterica serovar Hvittingfoss str. A4-620]